MPTFPTFSRSYTNEGYSYDVVPEVYRTQFYSGNSRQRKRFQKRDDIFNVRHVLTNAELVTFEAFVEDDLENGSLTYTGPYFTSDSEYTGTLEIIDGSYTCKFIPPDHWEVKYRFELKERDMTEEDAVYATVNSLGTISNTFDVISALAEMVNENTL